MSAIHSEDPLFKAVGDLPRVEPTAEHAERVRGRCRATLRQPTATRSIAFEPATVGAICALYAWHVMKIAIRIPLP